MGAKYTGMQVGVTIIAALGEPNTYGIYTLECN